MENKSVRIKSDTIDKLENAKHQISLNDEDLERYQEAIDDAIEIVKSSIISEPIKKLTRKEQGKIICEHLKHDGDDLDETVMISSIWDALKEIEKIDGSKDIKESKRVIGYDDYGKPLHEGDFCTFDVDVTDWNDYIPDSIRKVKTGDSYKLIAKLEGKIVYNDMDKCYELSIDNDYCPALYFHAIEPGSLRLDDSSKENKVSIEEVRINPDKIIFLEFSNENACKIARLSRLSTSPELNKIMGIYTKKSHEFAFSVNYYARLQDTNEFDVIACVKINNKNWLRKDFPDIADKVIKLADTYRNIEPVVVPLNKEELNIIEEKFNDYYTNVYGNDDIER